MTFRVTAYEASAPVEGGGNIPEPSDPLMAKKVAINVQNYERLNPAQWFALQAIWSKKVTAQMTIDDSEPSGMTYEGEKRYTSLTPGPAAGIYLAQVLNSMYMLFPQLRADTGYGTIGPPLKVCKGAIKSLGSLAMAAVSSILEEYCSPDSYDRIGMMMKRAMKPNVYKTHNIIQIARNELVRVLAESAIPDRVMDPKTKKWIAGPPPTAAELQGIYGKDMPKTAPVSFNQIVAILDDVGKALDGERLVGRGNVPEPTKQTPATGSGGNVPEPAGSKVEAATWTAAAMREAQVAKRRALKGESAADPSERLSSVVKGSKMPPKWKPTLRDAPMEKKSITNTHPIYFAEGSEEHQKALHEWNSAHSNAH